MRETVEGIAHEVFFNICEKKPTDIDVFFLDTIHFPAIEYQPRISVSIPLPRIINGLNIYEGIAFTNYESGKYTIWNLFFATICHAAAHTRLTDFSIYEQWIKKRNQQRAYEVIEFIEDIRVNDFIKKSFPEYYKEICKIDEMFRIIYERTFKNKPEYVRRKFAERYVPNISNGANMLKEKILRLQHDDYELIEYADLLYNMGVETGPRLPYRNYYPCVEKVTKWHRNLTITPDDVVRKNVESFVELWFDQLKRKEKMQKRYARLASDLNFDTIEFVPEHIGEYLRLRYVTHMFLKKISSQIKMIPNVMDEGVPEDIGLLEIQAAIQAIASQNDRIQIFEQDDYRRVEEEWAIILDTSSSMRLKFDEMKKFAICLGEAANELNSKHGRWGFFIFNNNFRIVKDHYEKYDQTAKARIGGIEITGLSFIGDAVKLCSRILEKENIERKYIFIITDGQQVGTLGGNRDMMEAIMETRKKGISVVAIGVPQGNSKIFTLSIPYENLRKTVAKFINAYTVLAGDNI
jgi:hypothetical protein